MLGKIATVKNVIVILARRIGGGLKGLLDPRAGGAGTGAARDLVRTRAELLAENAFLRQHLIAVRRKVGRVPVGDFDRLLMVLLARFNPAWRGALHIVKPETLLRWHRDLFRLFWRRKSRNRGKQPHQLDAGTIELIKSMALRNVMWGAERIRGELLKLGIRVSKRTI